MARRNEAAAETAETKTKESGQASAGVAVPRSPEPTVEGPGRSSVAAAMPPQPLEPTVEEHAQALGVPDWQFAGLKRLKRWGEGKRVSRVAFERELAAFAGGPMNQRRG